MTSVALVILGNAPSIRHRPRRHQLQPPVCDAIALHAQAVAVIFDFAEPLRAGGDLGSLGGNTQNSSALSSALFIPVEIRSHVSLPQARQTKR
jgi:hypothetical protein